METSRGRILIMDGDEGVRFFAGTVAAILGHEVVLAEDGNEAVRFLRGACEAGGGFDVVLLELARGDGDGALALMRRLRQIDPGVRVVVTADEIEHPVFAEYWRYGFRSALEKPYRLKRLSETLALALEPATPPVAYAGAVRRPQPVVLQRTFAS